MPKNAVQVKRGSCRTPKKFPEAPTEGLPRSPPAVPALRREPVSTDRYRAGSAGASPHGGGNGCPLLREHLQCVGCLVGVAGVPELRSHPVWRRLLQGGQGDVLLRNRG